MHVGHGNPRRSIDALERAGGVVGALVGAPLRAGLGPAGAVIVLTAPATLRVLLLMVGLGLRQVGRGCPSALGRPPGLGAADDAVGRSRPTPAPETVDLVAAELAGGPHDVGYGHALVAELDEEDELEEDELEEEEDEEEEEEYEDEADDEDDEDESEEQDDEEEEDEEEDDDDAAAASVEGEQLRSIFPPAIA